MLKRNLARILTNISGWTTNRKIVVIESDDWGSIRMPSKDVYEKCIQSGYPVDRIAYEKYDSIASMEDMEMLFETLKSHKDCKGNYPVITANCMVANPDFDKIKASDFKTYHYELITETFKKYPQHKDNFEYWKQGLKEKIFYPQYHGREHLNVSLFMRALQNGDRDAHFAFENEMPGSIPLGPEVKGNQYVVAMQYDSLEDKKDKLNIFLDGLEIFEQLFGYRSESTIPPNFVWSPDFNKAVMEKGVKYFQGIRRISEPMPGERNRRHPVYTGMKSEHGQRYSVRNAIFEPSMFSVGIKDPVSQCLTEMNIAFRMCKPAVITSHRINFVGFLDSNNRDRNLKMLNELLSRALKRWPDIEFMTSDQLGRIIDTSYNGKN